MNAHGRFFGYCATRQRVAPAKFEIRADTARLLRTLLLFDHVTVHSMRLREFPGFISDLGIEPTIEILKSNVLKIFPDSVLFGVPGDKMRRGHPEDSVSIARISGPREISFPQFLADLRSRVNLRTGEYGRSEEAIQSALAPQIRNYGQAAEADTYRDIAADSTGLKTAVAAELRRVHRYAISSEHFNLVMHPVAPAAFMPETNLPQLCRLPAKEIFQFIGIAMTVIAHLNLRIEEMWAHSSITGFDDADLSLFANRLRFLVDRQNTRSPEEEFTRVISLLRFPSIPAGHFDVDKFLRLRTSPDCADFRTWLSQTPDWSDREIADRVNSLHQTASRFYQGIVGQSVRVLASIGIGLFNPIAGAISSAADTFLLDKILRPSGAITFTASDYPSLVQN
jgi:hypothetical protein